MASSEEPGICGGSAPAIMPHGPDGRGWLTGTRVYARDVVEALDRLGSEAEVAGELGLSEHQVRVAIEWDERHTSR
jgi:uncharacterized protein (DUF433 family)